MAKVAAVGQLPSSNALDFGGGAGGCGALKNSTTTLKRKTPSELRGEILKRKNVVELVDESPTPVTCSRRNTDEAVFGPKKSDSTKAPRYTDKRMDELFPVTKNNIRLGLLSRKENTKNYWQENVSSECVGGVKNSGVPMDLNAKCQVQNYCLDDTVASEGGKDYSNQPNNTTEKCSTINFQSVHELSQGGEKLNGSSLVDMDKALKGLVLRQPHTASAPLAKSIYRTGNIMPQSFCSEFRVSGHDIPLDLTLKTTMRLLSSSSVNWLHRLISCGTLNCMAQLPYAGCPSESMTCSSEPTSTSQIINPGTLHSWVHPQSTLPRSAISVFSSAAAGQMDFLSKRQQAWEDSFRSLYYMLRKKTCKLFYVCTEQFVVLFAGSDGSKETKCSCYAYVSQSTGNLRSLLKEHNVSFSMPLCHSKMEEVTAEDVVGLSAIEKYNLGQTRAIETVTGVDNSPQSLLKFTGNKNVHGLYDFLLNYRFFLTSLTGGDVPILYSPVPFENAALSTPEVRCRQVRRTNNSSELKESNVYSEPNRGSSAKACYSVEIRDVYLPPWVISGICNAMRSNGGDFLASFLTESRTTGLNVGLDIARDQQLAQQKSGHPFGVLNATLSPHLHSAFLKGMKYCYGSYTAFLSSIHR
ncbi:hypothetical protein Pfo_004050 [Paulownia fortunei]|nr:hypothetical protein Pfo_004050 [Paulownia fortunei]